MITNLILLIKFAIKPNAFNTATTITHKKHDCLFSWGFLQTSCGYTPAFIVGTTRHVTQMRYQDRPHVCLSMCARGLAALQTTCKGQISSMHVAVWCRYSKLLPVNHVHYWLIRECSARSFSMKTSCGGISN